MNHLNRPDIGSELMGRPASHSEELAFISLLPVDPHIQLRRAFQRDIWAIVNGNVFAGLHGPHLFMRCPVMGLSGGRTPPGEPFVPFAGHPAVSGFVLVRSGDWQRSKTLHEVIRHSHELARYLAPKMIPALIEE